MKLYNYQVDLVLRDDKNAKRLHEVESLVGEILLFLWKNRQLGRFCLSHNILIYLNIYIRLKIKPNSGRIRSLS
jgi:hypothetical protein